MKHSHHAGPEDHGVVADALSRHGGRVGAAAGELGVSRHHVSRVKAKIREGNPLQGHRRDPVKGLPTAYQDATEAFFGRFAGHAPRYPALPRERARLPHLMVLDLVDVHIGKLAWAPEVGQNYDLKIAEQVYRHAVVDLLARAKGMEVGHFVVPIGSDFLHVDNLVQATTAGTLQDTDGRTPKIIEVAEAALVWAVELLAGLGRVTLLRVPGNHDWLLSLCLARTVRAWFRHCPHVEVDVSPAHRKYFRYHDVLLGFAHGDQEKPQALPGIMAGERARDWGETTCHEWHRGHEHRARKHEFMGLDTFGGVPVWTNYALSSVDAWHHSKGYVNTRRAAQGYFYDHRGLALMAFADARE